MYTRFALIAGAMMLPALAFTQRQPTAPDARLVPTERALQAIQHTATNTQRKLDRQSVRYTQKIARIEQRLLARLAQTDSTAATKLFARNNADLIAKVSYIPALDTLQTSLRFLEQSSRLFAHLPKAPQAVQKSLAAVQSASAQFNKAEQFQQLLRQRQQWLVQHLQQAGLARQLNKLNKQIYYYSQQVEACKQLLNNPQKLQRKAIQAITSTKAFQDFMRRHSQLASLFRLPGHEEDPLSAAMATLQTRDQVNNMIQQQIMAGGPNAQAQFQQQVQAAQTSIHQLKDKLPGMASVSDDNMPRFKPNNQKSKSFGQRLELGATLQSQQASAWFPVTTDLGFSIGYKFTDQAVAGIGGSYKLGWGKGWNDLRISHQGAGLRSFVDWKIKNSFWASGGFEMNYRPIETSNRERTDPALSLPTGSVWQQSGLIGLSKKYQLKKKLKGRMQLLWDFLSDQQVPRTRPLVFRVGYDIQ